MTAPASAEPTTERPGARRHRLVARVIVAAVAVLLGVVQGVVWAQLAPGQKIKVFADGSYVTLPTADYHPFVGLMLFCLAGAAVGLIVAAAAWRIRAVRGTATLLTLFAGTAAGSAVAAGLGLLLARGVDPATVGKTGHDSVVVAGASLSTPLALIAEPLLAVALYTFLAAWDGRADLGRTRRAAELADGPSAGPSAGPAAEPAGELGDEPGETGVAPAEDAPDDRPAETPDPPDSP